MWSINKKLTLEYASWLKIIYGTYPYFSLRFIKFLPAIPELFCGTPLPSIALLWHTRNNTIARIPYHLRVREVRILSDIHLTHKGL